ncbi:hypothetical protein [Heyndrickxia oleronia]|uniref:hypothetical protein n=1 Tax=Heyndrickxia oleronia TaxID=38875 RepID=UPI00333DB4A4
MITIKNPQKYIPSNRSIIQLCSMLTKKDSKVFKEMLSKLEEDIVSMEKDTWQVELKNE